MLSPVVKCHVIQRLETESEKFYDEIGCKHADKGNEVEARKQNKFTIDPNTGPKIGKT